MKKKQNAGQALVEYLFLFAFMSLISINMVKAFANTMGKTSGSLAVILTNQLTTGVCAKDCFYAGFSNKW